MSRYTTSHIRRVMQENGHATSEWHSLFTKAEDEIEGMTLVLCEYLDLAGVRREWSPEEFRQALDNFLGAAYSELAGACEDQLAGEIGRSNMEHVSPFMDWGAYANQKLKGVLVFHDGMYYHFSKAMGVSPHQKVIDFLAKTDALVAEEEPVASTELTRAREVLLSVGSQDMPVSGREVEEAIDAFEKAVRKAK